MPLIGCVQLRLNLMIDKDYELMPKFLWYSLQKWNGAYGKSIERCALSKDFLPDGKWPSIWGREEDFNGSSHFVELYPPLMEIIRHNNNNTSTSINLYESSNRGIIFFY